MLNAFFDLARPALLVLDPERAHELTVRALERGLHPRPRAPDDPCLASELAGLAMPNPIGVAAGFDKDARVADAVLALGCGFAEVGTLTPLPQAGNPQPRLFRLIADRAVINRLGFNNGGHQAALQRLQKRSGHGVVGVNIGANREAADRTADYVRGIEAFHGIASYLTINISSPNTPGLRDLQAPAALDDLLTRVMTARAARMAQGEPHRPIVVKLSPDVAEADLPGIAKVLITHSVDAIAVSNTTLARPALRSRLYAEEAGGLSGRPLFQRSTAMLARIYRETGGRIPLIGIGGIDSGETALAKIEAGASLIQLYTGLVYEGPGLIARIKAYLTEHCRRCGLARIAQATGARSEEWARHPIDG